jgi:hypothetical protein
MNTFLWVLQCILAAYFFMPGVSLIRSSKEKLIADGEIKPDGNLFPIRILGVLELLGCVGIIVPWLTGIAPILTPLTAVGYCLIMIGAIIIHTIEKGYKMLPMLIAILIVASLVAYYRFASIYR